MSATTPVGAGIASEAVERCYKPIRRAIADDLLAAIYKREGWVPRDRAGFNTRAARCNALYDITADPRSNRYVAVRKSCCTESPQS